jgi:hypothetical protein
MSAPILSFKPGDSSHTMPVRTCISWPGSETKTFTAAANNVLVGNNGSPYFYDSNFVINPDRALCNNVLWGQINAFFTRNITSPSVRNQINNIAGIQVANAQRLNTFSAGDSATANNFTKNIFDPAQNGGKFYSITGMDSVSVTNPTGSIPCLSNPVCQPRSIRYTLRNIFNPRDEIRQLISFIGNIPGNSITSTSFTSAEVSSPNPADFLTQLTWICSPNVADGGGNFGLGTVTEAKGKTIEMKGITTTNVRTIKREPIVNVIYDQKCLRWSMTQYEYVAGNGFVKSTRPRVDVELVEKIRPSSDILYSDYFEGTDTNKIVRYFEAINAATGTVITELYAIIDISLNPPLVYMCSSWRGETDPTIIPKYKIIQNGFNIFDNKSFISSVDHVEETSRAAFIPDMPLKWGVLPNRNMLVSQYGDSSNSAEISNFSTLVRNEFGVNYFILCGEKPQTQIVQGVVLPVSKRTLNLFSPNCENISLSICRNAAECSPYGLNICENGQCVVCNRTNFSACRSTEQCIENKCITRPACISSSAECPQNRIFRFCNQEKKVCVECNSSADCENGEICNVFSNLCLPPNFCTSNTDCVSGKECKDRVCVDIPPPPPSSTSRIGLVVAVAVGVLLLIYIFIKFRKSRM